VLSPNKRAAGGTPSNRNLRCAIAAAAAENAPSPGSPAVKLDLVQLLGSDRPAPSKSALRQPSEKRGGTLGRGRRLAFAADVREGPQTPRSLNSTAGVIPRSDAPAAPELIGRTSAVPQVAVLTNTAVVSVEAERVAEDVRASHASPHEHTSVVVVSSTPAPPSLEEPHLMPPRSKDQGSASGTPSPVALESPLALPSSVSPRTAMLPPPLLVRHLSRAVTGLEAQIALMRSAAGTLVG
jgi:hypothetical protein